MLASIRRAALCTGWVIVAWTAPLNSQPACAAVVHDELIDGELSNQHLSPTVLDFTIGDNTVIGTVADARGDMNTDVFSFSVPTGTLWTSLTIDDYNSSDDVAFLAINDDISFPYGVFELDAVDEGFITDQAFLGGTIFGPFDVTNGFNILPRAGNVAGRGFDVPLPEGDYTIYIQQIGASTDYSITVSIVTAIPEPGTASLLLLATAGFACRRGRRSRSKPGRRTTPLKRIVPSRITSRIWFGRR